MQGFNDKYLSRRITGDLRQKFRELEIMDEITKLRYEEKCSPKVTEITRGELIYSFRQWKGESYVPKTMYKDLKWSKDNPFPIEKVDETLPWELIADKKIGIKPMKKAPTDIFPASYYIPAKGSQILQTTSNKTGLAKDKRALEDQNVGDGLEARQAKKIKFGQQTGSLQGFKFKGFL